MQVRSAESDLPALSRCSPRRDRFIVDGPSQRHGCRGLLLLMRLVAGGLANRRQCRSRAVAGRCGLVEHPLRPVRDRAIRGVPSGRGCCHPLGLLRRRLPRSDAEQRADDQCESEPADLRQLKPHSRRSMPTCHTPPRTRDRCARPAETHHSREATQSIDTRARPAKGGTCWPRSLCGRILNPVEMQPG